MKVVILAGGYGTRLSEETTLKPKPMVEIGRNPILWHIMKTYSHYNFNEFIILLGYKGYYIKEYFANYFLHQNDVTFDLKNNNIEVHSNSCEPWKVSLIDTGLDTMTGGRIKKAQKYIGDESFLLTYGDGVSNVNIADLIKHHRQYRKTLTVTAVQPDARFGNMDINEKMLVNRFQEKPKDQGNWINGGYFVCENKVFDYLSEDDNCIFEQQPLQTLANENELVAYKHHDYWQCMDTLRDNQKLNELWKSNKAKWKVWHD